MFVSAVRSDSLCSVFVLSDGTVFRFGRRLLFFVRECSITLSNKRNLDSDGVSKDGTTDHTFQVVVLETKERRLVARHVAPTMM
ncbi:hypothetical protein L798_04040 [Zootermopsis nevadensis]|uniref:Uncharacterized protein n=1 Tax=Zootermopsis nevadensis TaxID=136037 RepID=A0A067RNF3_ZOONE|nr:hypothetical protein L798_04040 [Zootermopsis nevadensis]